MKTDLLALFTLFSFSLFFNYRNIRKAKSWDSITIFGSLFFVSFPLIAIAQGLYINDLLSFTLYEQGIRSLLGGISTLFLTLVVVFLIDDYTKKKAKVLFRLPFIGWLVGLYLSTEQLPYFFALIFLVSGLLLLRKAKELRFLRRKVIIAQLIAFLVSLALIRYNIHNIAILSGLLCLLMTVSSPIVSMAQIRQFFSKGDVSES